MPASRSIAAAAGVRSRSSRSWRARVARFNARRVSTGSVTDGQPRCQGGQPQSALGATLCGMLEPSARLLGLLSLLEARRTWTGPELADRLSVGVRTIRRDIGKLRSLGYPVHADPGVAGGHRLRA